MNKFEDLNGRFATFRGWNDTAVGIDDGSSYCKSCCLYYCTVFETWKQVKKDRRTLHGRTHCRPGDVRIKITKRLILCPYVLECTGRHQIGDRWGVEDGGGPSIWGPLSRWSGSRSTQLASLDRGMRILGSVFSAPYPACSGFKYRIPKKFTKSKAFFVEWKKLTNCS